LSSPAWEPERHCVIDTNLVNYAGSLLPGRHYDREVTLVNHSDAPAPFTWYGHDEGAGLLVYPCEGILPPNGGSVTCVVELTPPKVQRVDLNLKCVVEHGPSLPLRVTAEVEGPEVAIAQSQVDFGLLQQHVAGDTYLLIRNQSAIPGDVGARGAKTRGGWEGCAVRDCVFRARG
jgi:hypothetical protein